LNRRRFFGQVFGKALVTVEQLAGKPHLRIPDLEEMADESLAKLIPVVREDAEIVLNEHGVKVGRPGGNPDLDLVGLETTDLVVFNLINGERTVAEISSDVANGLSCDEKEAFARVKALVLHLTKQGVCVPKNYAV
jgi:hypothetical protein